LIEDLDHLFVKRDFYGRIWSLVSSWSLLLLNHLTTVWWVRGLFENVCLALNIIWLSVVWVIWKERNKCIIQHKEEHLQSLSEKVKL